MRALARAVTALALLQLSRSQNVQVPSTCIEGFESGHDIAHHTVPYTYDQVLSILGDFSNLTYAGVPDGTVTLNGTDNTVGTVRTYDLAGSPIMQTLDSYSRPPSPGPFRESHTTAPLTVASAGNASVFNTSTEQSVVGVCDDKASYMAIETHFCSENVSAVQGLLHMLHSGFLLKAGELLGGMNYTSCKDLGSQVDGPDGQDGYWDEDAKGGGDQYLGR